MASKTPGIKQSVIDDEILRLIYASDQDMYPAPLSYERLQGWVTSCPELSICFSEEVDKGTGYVPIGVVIVLPVKQEHWEDLLVGKLKEVDIDPETMLVRDDQCQADIGLHLFHIERLEAFQRSGRLRHFAGFAMENVREAVESKPRWNVLGYSALTATSSGRAMCKRMGFTPTGYTEIFVASDQDENSSGNIEMMSIYPGNSMPSEDILGQCTIINRSEMAVRRSNTCF